MRVAPVTAFLLLASSCGSRSPALAFAPLEPWAEPFPDAIAAGEVAFPDGFRRGVTTLCVFDGRMWIGYGDGAANLGSVTPIEFRWLGGPDDPETHAAVVLGEAQGAPQRTPTDSGEEVIDRFRVLDGVLWQAGNDSVDADEAWTQAKDPRHLIEGNVFRLETRDGAPVWRKLRSVSGGEHVHDIASLGGVLYAVGSGADVRAEFEAGEVFRYLWRSVDRGRSFTTLARFRCPDPGRSDTRFRQLLPVGEELYVFGYVNPYEDGGPWEARNLVLRAGALRELDGELGALVVDRTFPTGRRTGLAVARGAVRTFEVRPQGPRELGVWAGRRVIDVAPLPGGERFLLLSGNGGAPERFAVHVFRAAEPDELDPVAELSVERPTALAWFAGSLFVGTADGRVLRARGTR